MSLFGGDSGATSPNHSDTSPAPSSSPEPEAHLQSAQPVRGPEFAPDFGLHEEYSSDDETETDESDDDQPTRPNRFKGNPITWQRYTWADRQVAASLDQLRDNDLSAHLYNAHALKRRVRLSAEELANIKSWQSRDDWLKRGKDLQYIDETGQVQTNLVPSKDWTAWPLQPDRLPSSEKFGGDREQFDADASAHHAGDEMREQMLATFLRIAKENWNARETESEHERGRTREPTSRSRSRSKSAWSARTQRSASRTDVSMKDGGDHLTEGEQTQDEEAKRYAHIIGTSGTRTRQPEEPLKPTFLADDEKAMQILRPTINSILSQLTNLAQTVRYTRLNHYGGRAYGELSSQSDFTSGAESSAPDSRSHSRSRSRKPRSKPGSRIQSRASSAEPGPQHGLARNQSARSRLGKRTLQNDSDDDDDSSSNGVSDSENQLGSRKRNRSSSAASSTPAPKRHEADRLGLIDWSEVLGLAAVTGWSPTALSRTAARCAALFDESMSFQCIPTLRPSEALPKPVVYMPSTIPPPPDALIRSGPPKRPLFQPGMLRCPHNDCYAHEKDFKEAYRVIEHIKRAHKYDPRTNDESNEERRKGGVHIDGYLKEVVARHGGKGRIIGKGKGKNKQAKVGTEDEDDGDDEQNP